MEIKILKEVNCPENVIEHCKAVCRKSMEIASNFENADLDLIRKGSLLHDIGRCKTHELEHAVVGRQIAAQYGYSEDVLNIIERHIGAGITEEEAEQLNLPVKSYMPNTLEEKIVAHGDNLISGTKEVDVDYVIAKWNRRMENPQENIKRLVKLNYELIEQFKD